jgi:hypothetical protein
VTAPVAPQSPEWWLGRLYGALCERRAKIDVFQQYYDGDHPLPWLAPQARDEFRRILRMTRSNYVGLVVDAMVERIMVEGFRLSLVGSASEDDDEDVDSLDAETWRIWQANNMDAASDGLFLEAGICGMSYMQSAPNPKDPSTPLVWAEHPTQAIVDYMPGGRLVRAASLKAWVDDWTGMTCATVQTPEYIFKFQASGKDGAQWTRRAVAGEDWGAKNPAGEVTMAEIPNNPRMLTGGRSEIADVIDVQDRINKTIADRLMTQDFGAFPQKWSTGWATEDDKGNPTPPIDIGRNRMVTTDVETTKFGQWDAAPLDPYSNAKREDVKDIASRTRTPAQYLLGEMSNVNGETLKASEAGHISKIRSRIRHYGEGIEAGVRSFRKLAGLPDLGAQGMEAIFRNPEFRTAGELADSLTKLLAAGVIDIRQAREDYGYSATQISRMESREAAAAADPAMDKLVAHMTAGTGGLPAGG